MHMLDITIISMGIIVWVYMIVWMILVIWYTARDL
jgi:hypothetical protein